MTPENYVSLKKDSLHFRISEEPFGEAFAVNGRFLFGLAWIPFNHLPPGTVMLFGGPQLPLTPYLPGYPSRRIGTSEFFGRLPTLK